MRRNLGRLGLAALCALALALPGAEAARAAGEVRLFTGNEPGPSNVGGFEGPCGLAVDAGGRFYVSDYYRNRVVVFSSSFSVVTQLSGTGLGPESKLEGPCGLAVDASGNLYVNNFHHNVAKFTTTGFPPHYNAGTVIDSAHSTGVAVDPVSGDVYVDDRSYVAVYDSSGAPVEVGGVPLRIGQGSLEDGYGAAFSTVTGDVYVADAADDTVKVYNPAGDVEEPVETIDGHGTPAAGFVSLRDAALAVSASGTVYVADDLQPEYFERPEATVYAFDQLGDYVGRLSTNVVDARPPGLAVDNSPTASRGRVYVTSGNSEGAGVYVYEPGAQVPAGAAAATLSAGPEARGSGPSSVVGPVSSPRLRPSRQRHLPQRGHRSRPRRHR
jgi:DNA-binding beta-propeller fold protein YncE